MEKVSEGPARITKATIEAAWRRRRKGLRLTIRDAECRGLALVVNPTGMAWMLSYKPRGVDPRSGKRPATREVLLGTPADMSPEMARASGGAMKGQAKRGEDPARDRKAALLSAASDRAAVLRGLADAYALVLPSRPKLRGTGRLSEGAVDDEMRHVRKSLEAMGVAGLPVSVLSVAHIRKLLTAEAGRPTTARHRFGALSRFLDWCQDEGLIQRNPCVDIGRARRPRMPRARTHHLAIHEMAELWKAAERVACDPEELTFSEVHGDLVRFLVAVPSRRGEAASIQWDHLDLEAGTWTMPDHLTKNGDPHRLPLPQLALTILAQRWSASGQPSAGLVFPSPKAKRAIQTWSDMKTAMDTASGVTGWRWHDLRRSFATVLADNGVAEAVADAMLNHRQAATRGGVLGVYQQAKRRPEQAAAMKVWNGLLSAAIEGRPAPSAEVVPLRA